MEKHWQEISAVAIELLRYRTIDDVHAEIAMEVARGVEGAMKDLAQYLEVSRRLPVDEVAD
ncbi:MAG: hypothetical protein GY811_00920 [Myxococcales bacterium]|nr:hypothetical protein [Myxococcales bacterium]